MTCYRKNTWLAVLALVLGLVALPVSHSAVQSAERPFSAWACERVSHLSLDNMNVREREFARECDVVEASHDWEQQYGGLNDLELSAGIVYE